MRSETGQTGEPVLAMILLEEPVFPEAAKVLDYLRANRAGDWRIEREETKNATAFFHMEGETSFYALMPAPIPWSDLEGPCATAWYWPEAKAAVQKHRAHLLISLLPNDGGPCSMEKAMLVSKLTAALLAVTEGAIGVYWGGGRLVQSRQNFIDRVQDTARGSVPVDLWIEMRIGRCSQDTYGLCTTGLQAFGRMEIEIQYSSRKPAQLYEFAFGVISYLLKAGPVIKDGDTLGHSDRERIAVRYGKSLWPDRGQVMILAY